VLPEEIKNLTGKVFSTSVFDIEKDSIRRFAGAVGDMNPVYHDAGYAGKSRYGGIIAPPGFLASVWFWEGAVKTGEEKPGSKPPGLFGLMQSLVDAGYGSVIDSGIDFEFFKPVKAGDTITLQAVIKDARERSTAEGSMVFLVTDTTFTNQDGDVVATSRWTTIHR
jgi:acyl dehydratase